MQSVPLTGEYAVEDVSEIASPSLLVFQQRLASNIRQMVEIAGDASRLTPHCKTHKIAEIVKLLIEQGVTSHKCATIAEAEMLASAGASRVLLAYNPVGPNINRVVQLLQTFPAVKFSVTCDHILPLQQLSAAVTGAQQQVEVLLDINCGMHRTGVAPGEAALELYKQIHASPGINAGGLHVYDGHNHQADLEQRRQAVDEIWQSTSALRQQLLAAGLPCPRYVAGGTGTFPLYAEVDPQIELSPGTPVFYDAGYTRMFPDLPFQPAAVLLTRVVSRPSADTLTLDVGNKAVAADPPAGARLYFPALPEAQEIIHSEEHLVLRTPAVCDLEPGTALVAVPMHICPTSALHQQVHVIRDGAVAASWDVTARNRCLTI